MKKNTTLLTVGTLALMLTLGLTACGDKTCEHTYDNACDTICNICEETRTITHTPNADDGDCLTAVTCQRCPEVMTPARTEHEANEDDGDCTTAVTCKHCTTVMTEAKTSHEAGEDDSDCTTEVTCEYCTVVMVEANETHEASDDGDCTTEVACGYCSVIVTEAKEHDFTGEWQLAVEGHYHICENDGCTVTDTMVGHTVDESGNCSVCGYNDGLAYTELTNDDGTVIGYSVAKGDATATEIVIPSYYNGLPVTSIGGYAFQDCTSLTSVVIPDSVTSIRYSAFEGCTSLTSIEIPDSVTSIADRAFYECTSLESITIPDSVTSIGSGAFGGCTSLARVTIGDSVTSIGRFTFSRCASLTYIEVDENNEYYQSIDGNLYSKDGTTLIQYAIGKQDALFTIPDTVTSVGGYAFNGCTSLESITIPDSVTSIGSGAFNDCTSLESITIPDSVTSIRYSTFEGCTSLSSITLPDSVTSIGKSAFNGCASLTSITFDGTVEQWNAIDFADYWNDSSGSYVIYCADGQIAKGGTVKYYGVGLEYTLNDDGKSYSVTGIGTCSDTDLVIPATYNGLPVTSIGNYAFDGCTSLESITIPDSVTSIGDWAFNSFAAEASVIINGVKTYYSTFDNAIAFANGKDDITIVIESNCIYNATVFESGNITIDLNGKTIEGSPDYSNLNMAVDGACVTIRDTVGGGAMLLVNVGAGTSGTLIIESGTYNYAYAPQYLKITGGEFDCVTITTGDEATISGGSFAKIGIYSGVGTLDDLLADGYCFYDADGNEVDTSSVELNGYWYYLYNVTVGRVDNTEGRE